ncbi:MAG: ribbon-helix-helix protein, CopG family [Acidobacteriaceae bacterium]|nr:ribbon-helix-helix protein, CopG family [Acidobacteriaceae bacterium]
MYDYVIIVVMNVIKARTSHVFTISFPEDLAAEVKEVAQKESRNISELFREAFRIYRAERLQQRLSATRAAVTARSKEAYNEDDVERLVDEIRAELHSKGRRRA